MNISQFNHGFIEESTWLWGVPKFNGFENFRIVEKEETIIYLYNKCAIQVVRSGCEASDIQKHLT